ncbi:hypothetical protein MPL3356_490032 [Mesorhizobium plurifarium]|uniref:Uncharacterized protein n=1 Tax=Mesorhizobium plurifarium TaxID=69974 RepID=A0A090G1N3_MESPL|nr:hypothetical protein MPL3356_490032 [Mesorhizobium plurifarium]
MSSFKQAQIMSEAEKIFQATQLYPAGTGYSKRFVDWHPAARLRQGNIYSLPTEALA